VRKGDLAIVGARHAVPARGGHIGWCLQHLSSVPHRPQLAARDHKNRQHAKRQNRPNARYQGESVPLVEPERTTGMAKPSHRAPPIRTPNVFIVEPCAAGSGRIVGQFRARGVYVARASPPAALTSGQRPIFLPDRRPTGGRPSGPEAHATSLSRYQLQTGPLPKARWTSPLGGAMLGVYHAPGRPQSALPGLSPLIFCVASSPGLAGAGRSISCGRPDASSH
jgi:hypothetical protein